MSAAFLAFMPCVFAFVRLCPGAPITDGFGRKADADGQISTRRIETRSARLRLPGAKRAYWQEIEPGLGVGYHRPKNGGAGTWWGRVRVEGGSTRSRRSPPPTITSMPTARRPELGAGAGAQCAPGRPSRPAAGPYTVADACRDYVADLRARKGDRAANEADGRLRKHLLPALGERRLADLSARPI